MPSKNHPKITVGIEQIYPDDCLEFLRLNRGNRPVEAGHVLALASEIITDNWKCGAGCISIDWNGLVVDGQHRLHAIIKANMPAWVVIVRNVDPEVFGVVDRGRVRTLAQLLALDGEKNTARLATILRWMQRILVGKDGPATNVPDLTLEDSRALLSAFPFAREATDLFYGDGFRATVPSPAPFAAVFSLAMYSENTQESVAEYGRQLITGEDVPAGSVVSLMRTKLIKAKSVRGQTRRAHKVPWSASDKYLLACATKALVFFLHGRTVRTLQFDPVRETYPPVPGTPDITHLQWEPDATRGEMTDGTPLEDHPPRLSDALRLLR